MFSRRKPPSDNFPEISQEDGTSAGYPAFILRVKNYAEKWALFYIGWYDCRAALTMLWSTALRYCAFICALIGSLVAVARLLDPNWQAEILKWILQTLETTLPTGASAPPSTTGPKTIPSELGLVFFTLSAGLILVTRISGVVENRIRFVSTELELQRKLANFRFEWTRLMTAYQDGSGPSKAQTTEVQLETIQEFLNDVFELVEKETAEWAIQFKAGQAQIEEYIKQTRRQKQSERTRQGAARKSRSDASRKQPTQ